MTDPEYDRGYVDADNGLDHRPRHPTLVTLRLPAALLAFLIDLPPSVELAAEDDGMVRLLAEPNDDAGLTSGWEYALHYEEDEEGEPALQSFVFALTPKGGGDDAGNHEPPR